MSTTPHSRTLPLVLAAVAACGGKSTSTVPPTAPIAAVEVPAPPPPEYRFEVGPEPVRATRFSPEALSSLEWPITPPQRSLDAQRRRFAAAKANARSKEAEDLATLLWYAEPADSEASRPFQEEARMVLREQAATGSAPENLLMMLTVAERALGDDAAAAVVYDELILRFPSSTRAWRYRAVRAWLALRTDVSARAAEIVTGVDLGAEATPPTIHYVAAWIALRKGDAVTAHAQLVIAAQKWSDLESWDALRRELYLVSALSDAGSDYIVQIMEGVLAGPPQRKGGSTYERTRVVKERGKTTVVKEERVLAYSREWELVEIGRALWLVGRSDDARAVLERALHGEPLAAAAAGITLIAIADATEGPAEAAARAEEAAGRLDAAETDPDAGDVIAVRERLSNEVRALADGFGSVWEATGSTAHANAARRLYAIYAALPDRADAAQVAGRAALLDGEHPATPPSPARYRSAVIDRALASQRARIEACFTRASQADPLEGGIELRIASQAEGSLAEVEANPREGGANLDPVASCVARVAQRLWLPWPTPSSAVHVTIRLEPR